MKHRKTFEPISKRETAVIELLRHGFTHKQIGAMLFISADTVNAHIRNISRKFNVNKETALVDEFLHRKHSLIDFEL